MLSVSSSWVVGFERKTLVLGLRAKGSACRARLGMGIVLL